MYEMDNLQTQINERFVIQISENESKLPLSQPIQVFHLLSLNV